jgi:methylmalonyl-CoA/ethylmalonyl-CoA epimerase
MAQLEPSRLPLGALTELRQIGMVCHNLEASIRKMLKSGIGPWKVFTFDRSTVTERVYRGKPGNFEFKIALADMPGMNWELIQPYTGDNIFSDFLKERGEGIHHLLYDSKGMPLAQKQALFDAAGFECRMSGKWLGQVHFAYYQCAPDLELIVEILDRRPDFSRPEPEEIIS